MYTNIYACEAWHGRRLTDVDGGLPPASHLGCVPSNVTLYAPTMALRTLPVKVTMT